MKIIFDMASVIQTGLRKGTDDEGQKIADASGRLVQVNSAAHGYENAVSFMLWAIEYCGGTPSDVLMVFEGRDSKKKRMQILQGYKADSGSQPREYYDEYNKCKEMVKDVFRKVGACAVTQDYAEGDDTCKFLADNAREPVYIFSNDGDLAVLRGINKYGFEVKVLSGTDGDKLPENVFEPGHITLYKALVGDASDKVKGCPQFGAVAWADLLAKYGSDGIYEIAELVAKNKQNDLAIFAKNNQCKLLNKIVDNWNQVYNCYRAVSIYSEWVNTRYHPLKWEPGIVLAEVKDERFRKYLQNKRLVTADNYDKALEFLKEQVRRYPNEPVAFDLETSSPEESDEWLAGQGNDDGVDPLGSYIVGFSLTFGPGGRFTYYVSVKHHDTNNVSMVQARQMIESVRDVVKPIHNTAFELVLLYNNQAADEDGTLWRDLWKDNGEFGFLPNIEDTLFMASYVDENAISKGLKALSKSVLGYEQVDFDSVRTYEIEGSKPWPGGRVIEYRKREPVFDADGKPVMTEKGVQKVATVYYDAPVFDADGNPVLVRKRNAEGFMESVQKTKKQPVMCKKVRYKMHEMPATAVFDYGADDTICTMAYYRFAKMHMSMVDNHYHIYRQVEIDAAYLHAKNYFDGFNINVEELVKQKKRDAALLQEQEAVLHDYLISKGWVGTKVPSYTAQITPSEVKEAYGIVMGLDEPDDEEEGEDVQVDPVMGMRIRKMDKIIDLIASQEQDGAEMFALRLRKLVEGNADQFNAYIAEHFDGKPKFKYSSKQMCKLIYEVMGMTIKVRNKPTIGMLKAGIREGNPQANALAIDYAIIEAKEKGMEVEGKVLMALKLIVMVNTRNGLFYNPYPTFMHWKTSKVHSSHRQCHANTRRASSAAPNMQQMSAHAKVKGYESDFRRNVVPHKRKAVIVAMDFNAQELRVIADDSKDPNMLACYVGEHKKDLHSITGAGIVWRKARHLLAEAIAELADEAKEKGWSEDDYRYYAFKRLEQTAPNVYGDYRKLGKQTNFASEYGAMAPKLSATLMVSESDAQLFIDAREEAFAVSSKWKSTVVIAQAREQGFVTTKLGAKRHLADLLDSPDRSLSSKAERQAVNFRIQGSCAEMTKLAEGRMWRAGLFTGRFDAVCLGPIHDEVVASVALEDLAAFIPAMHACMVAPYADMEVPIVSSIDAGPNFYDSVSFGESADEESVKSGISKLMERFPELVM